MSDLKRCSFVKLNSELYIAYHDYEWGVPVYDDNLLFLDLSLEILSSGLSFYCVLQKRASLKEAFDDFIPDRVALYDEAKINKLMENKKIIRNKMKIEAIINNSREFIKIREEFNGFHNYIWSFSNNKIIYESGKTKSELSDIISKDLKRRGFRAIGSITIYSYLQAIGIIYSHSKDCFLYKKSEE